MQPRPRRLFHALLIAATALSVAGCARGVATLGFASTQQADVLAAAARAIERDSRTWNVAHASLRGRPWLGVDAEARLRLEQLRELVGDPPSFRAAAQDATDAMLAKGRRDLLVGEQGLEPPRLDLAAALDAAALEEHRELAGVDSPAECAEWLEERLHGLPRLDKHDGRTMRILSALPAAPFVNAWIAKHAAHEWRGANWRDFGAVALHVPDTSQDEATASHLAEASDDELLAFYAPLVAQEIPADAPPDFRDDRIGRAGLVPDRHGHPVAEIDESRPTLYGHVTRGFIEGRWLRQVNYSFWYHDHPSLKRRDPEAGRTEGQLVRITLDEANEPLVCEAVYACGCYHRIYPVDALEAEARRENGDPVQGDYSIAASVPGRIDPIVPETAGAFDPRHPHPVVSVRSGFHLVAAVRFGDTPPPVAESVRYELLPSDALEALPWGNEVVSFFGRDGLVRGADRPEALLMYPSGIYHAGTPRADGLQLIHFDQYDYNDPGLLGVMLRLPAPGERDEDLGLGRATSRAADQRVLDKL